MQYFGIFFLLMLFLEIMSIVWMADWLGGGITFLLMIAGFALGLFMLRRMGVSGLLVAASAARGGGKVSLYQLLWPVRFGVAAVLLMSPGFVSTLAAAVLMLPFKGKPVADLKTDTPPENDAGSGFTYTSYTHASQRHADDVIEGEYTVTDGPGSKKPVPDYIENRPK